MILPITTKCLAKKCTSCGITLADGEFVSAADIAPIWMARASARKQYGGEGLALALRSVGGKRYTDRAALAVGILLAADHAASDLLHRLGGDLPDDAYPDLHDRFGCAVQSLLHWERGADCLAVADVPVVRKRLSQFSPAPAKKPRRRLSDGGR